MHRTCLILLLMLLTAAPPIARAAQPLKERWKPFRNIEMSEYCLLLPLDGYSQNYDKSDVKAKHVFTHRANKKREITVWGMDRAEGTRKLSTESYYKQYFAGAEAQGLAIEERKLDATAKRFHSWGYWSNAYYESRFLEIVWLRGDEVIKLRATFPVADVALWKARLGELLKQTTVCKPE